MWRTSPRCSTSPFVLGVAALLGLSTLAISVVAPEPADAWAREILSEGPYQTELPLGTPSSTAAIPFMVRGLGTLLLWLFGLVGLVLFGVWLAGELWRAPAGAGAARPTGPGARRQRTEISAAEAQRLARAGRHADAIHALLLVAIRLVGRDDAQRPSPSRTSREILQSVSGSEAERNAFGELVRHVELSRFGGRTVGPAEYEHCWACLAALDAGTR